MSTTSEVIKVAAVLASGGTGAAVDLYTRRVPNALTLSVAVLGISVAAATPRRYRPAAAMWKAAAAQAKRHGASLRWTDDPRDAVRGADVVYTDVWVSMGQERERGSRRKAFQGYQLNPVLLKHATTGCRVMHCLPAHRGEEITDGVMESKQSLIFEQAENRLHVQKALLVFLLKGVH